MSYFALSHSFTTELLECPRKFQLSPKSLTPRTEISKNMAAAFGTVFGISIAEYMHSKDADKAILLAFMHWPFPLNEIQTYSNRSVWNIVHAIQDVKRFNLLPEFQPLAIEGQDDWRERAFGIVEGNCIYAGTIDQAFSLEGVPTVIDYKTGDKDCATLKIKYSNQDQLLAYAVMFGTYYNLPRVAYCYLLYSTIEGKFEQVYVEVTKELASEWIASIFARFEMLKIFESLPKAPKNGRACYSYNRPCQFYGICDDMQKAELVEQIPESYRLMDFKKVKDWITNVLSPKGKMSFEWRF